MSKNRKKTRPPRSDSRPERNQGGRSARPSRAPVKADGLWLYGQHPVLAALANPKRRKSRLLVTAAGAERLDGFRGQLPVEPEMVERSRLDEMLPEGALHQGLALKCQELEPVAIEDVVNNAGDNDRIVILDQVTDPHNVGAILRSAAVFGARALIIPHRHAPAETAVLAKSASGALESVPIVHVGNLARAMERLKDGGFWCVGFAGEAEATLADVAKGGKLALVMGAEGDGMRRLTRENCDHLVRIPMVENQVGSLNVSNAAAVALYATLPG